MSQLIPWIPQYELNMPDIDHQHRELFRMLNGLLEATWDGKGDEFIRECLEFMADYTVAHFATEEKYMIECAFPGYPEHKKAHDDLTAQVTDFIVMYGTKGASTDLLVSVILQLGNWTRDHIRDMDQEMGLFITSAKRYAAMY